MCFVEVVSLSSTNCEWAPLNPHVWQKFSYTLCPPGVARRRPCDNALAADGQTHDDIGTPRMTVCPVCTKLAAAVSVREEAKRIADEEYARAEAAAYRDQRFIYPPPSESSGGRVRGGKRREDRHDRDGRHRDEGRGKNHGRDERRHDDGRQTYYK